MSACGCCGEYNGEHDQYCSVTQVSKLETLLSQEQARGRRLMEALEKIAEPICANCWGEGCTGMCSSFKKEIAAAALAEEEAGKWKSLYC